MSKTNELIKQAAEIMKSFNLDSKTRCLDAQLTIEETRQALFDSSNVFNLKRSSRFDWTDSLQIYQAKEQKEYSLEIEQQFYEHCEDLELINCFKSSIYTYETTNISHVTFTDSTAASIEQIGKLYGFNHHEVLRYLEYEQIFFDEFRVWLRSGGLRHIALAFRMTTAENIDRDFCNGLEDELIDELLECGCDDSHLLIFCGIDDLADYPKATVVWDTNNRAYVKYH